MTHCLIIASYKDNTELQGFTKCGKFLDPLSKLSTSEDGLCSQHLVPSMAF